MSGTRKAIVSTAGPGAVEPYSQGISTGSFVFLSGQIPLRADGSKAAGGTAEHTQQCLDNIRALLAEAGLTMDDVVKTTVFMTDLGQFAAMNEVYGKSFRPPYPARSTVQAAALPKGADIEIEVVAARP